MIIWIASYPKSGNTWVRSFLSSYIFNQGKKFNFEDLEKIRSFPSDEEINFLKQKFGSYKFTHMAENWDFFQKGIIKKNKYTFLKTHNALCNVKGNDFTNLDNTLGLIYLIRDPRDVLISYSSHLNLDLKTTSKLMTNLNIMEKTPDFFDRTLLSSWSNHYNSWKHFPGNKIIIKYEDLIDNPKSTFLTILKFLKKIMDVQINEDLISKTINLVAFKELKKLEKIKGFPENKSLNDNHIFFKEGTKNQWKEKLPKELQFLMIDNFKNEMQENGYI